MTKVGIHVILTFMSLTREFLYDAIRKVEHGDLEAGYLAAGIFQDADCGGSYSQAEYRTFDKLNQKIRFAEKMFLTMETPVCQN